MKNSIWKKLSFFPPIIVGMLTLVWANARNSLLHEHQQQPRKVVKTIPVTTSVVVPRIKSYGYAQPSRTWVGMSQVSGEVIYVHEKLKKGEIVHKGTVVVKIDPREYEINITKLNANSDRIDAQLEELRVSMENNKALLKIEQQSLEWNKREVERQKKLMRNNVAAQSTYEAQLRNFLAQKHRVRSLQNSLNLVPTQKKMLLTQKQEIAAQLQSAVRKLRYTKIRAPFTGLVTEVTVTQNQVAASGQVLLRVDDISVMEIEAQFWKKLDHLLPKNEKRILGKKLRENPQLLKQMGVQAKITWEGNGRRLIWHGDFVRFRDDIDPQTRSFGMVFAVYNTPQEDVPIDKRQFMVKGMFCEVVILGKKRAALCIPRHAMHSGNTVYFVDNNSRLQKRAIHVDFWQDNMAIIENLPNEYPKIIVSPVVPAVNNLHVMEGD
ncbi:efflux RND transporter periplasmic adaptor subunit [Candidatus Uabimicrobium amorphum]|uniref:Acriflavin resistance protein n=1 Tax=Uabimicrobium amorphum TaxID=2596890 RepID=A0A5S9ITL6_UABAM|nr:HlyD family efflux transporter periplasmic adaptor subunit [Candidatus Uabimicrobium amorphum]BBM87869.1 acriflavin resistance protein [Candidatus Uabimicrobium amorphum]